MTYPQLDLENVAGPKATIQTNQGDIKIQLFPTQAPKAVENFVALAKQGYYDGIIFHRVIPDFMIQGGDPTGTGAGGQSSLAQSLKMNSLMKYFNLDGALSMANAGPNTNGSQFFIVSNENVPADMLGDMKQAGYPSEVIDAYKQGGTPWLDHHHTVFGQTISGLDVVEKISNAARDYQDKPNDDITIKTVVIENATK